MGWAVLRSALDLLLRCDYSAPVLSFYGGEPTLELPLIRRAVTYLEANKSPGMMIDLRTSTNGTLLDGDTVQFLADHLVETQISFDGIEAAQELRAPGTFPRLDRYLGELRTHHPEFFRDRCSASVTMSSRNLPYLADSFAYLLGSGVGRITVTAVVTHDQGWRFTMIDQLVEQIAAVYRMSAEHLEHSGQVPFVPFRPEQADPSLVTQREPGAMCRVVGNERMAVDVDGNVTGCVMFAESYQTIPDGIFQEDITPMRMGKIRDQGFAERYRTYPVAARMARMFNNKQEKYSSYRKCRGCKFLHACTVCPVSIGHIPDNTDPNRVPDIQCAINLVLLAAREHFLRHTYANRQTVAETAGLRS